jgi:cyclase
LTNKILDVIHDLYNQSIKFLINTHWHPDHTGGNENFGKSESLIISHENVRERLSTEQFIEFMERKIKPSSMEALPIITSTDSISFHINNETVLVSHFPNAHTDGDSMIYFKENNVLHTGDIFVKNRYSFIDTSSNGTIDGIIEALEKIIPLLNKESVIIPCHGDISNLNDLYEYLSMLQDVRKNISSQLIMGILLNKF